MVGLVRMDPIERLKDHADSFIGCEGEGSNFRRPIAVFATRFQEKGNKKG
jgi:predicted alternative tryptophan synthase beta-subunit